jgi:hypothetical protein
MSDRLPRPCGGTTHFPTLIFMRVCVFHKNVGFMNVFFYKRENINNCLNGRFFTNR